MIELYVKRDGSIVECGDDFDLVSGRGMSSAYLRRLVGAVKPNEANYIDIESADRSTESLRMALNKIAKDSDVDIKTFSAGNLFGFVVVSPEKVFI
ncbi:hypothetical protein JLDGIFFK_00029 [Klebsiella phage vB_KppS-Samwise]|uniref:Uncharacterized protein n=1 Tax=Klebsiella phage vB_KppS-Samwise TaxID=2762815 RepID=A0A7R8RA84_9CAUD|nr:hypothetical protein OBHDAGOG_00057 [Klebsiella phage vB_KaS-Ahsoka]CAD5239547.1 hypothetical protein JLDGIFFK_00029 [Klebsiella phage vB_KppS-Samwise]CAD5239650.1 hypothetical protein EONHMLJF_00029 [Klebsiella phage vB_KaS-Gatomon]CAJ1038923.1 hypothetical protein SAMARA_00029 [Klebsiella phage vB_KppS-Samwise]CAJ1038992.1 hypothetical protein LLOFRUDD_00011 [Klebsiella phage vB_KppS-Samwise]